MNSMMEYQGYHAKIEFSAEDGVFIGKVFGITDTLIFDGETVAELTEMFHQTIDDYIKLCEENGKTPEKEFKGSLNIRISSDLHKKLALCAEESEQSINQIINAAIEDYFCTNKTDKGTINIVISSETRDLIYKPNPTVRDDGISLAPSFTLIEGGKKNYGVN